MTDAPNPNCPKCLGNGYCLEVYPRPGGRPGNRRVQCKTCMGECEAVEYELTTSEDDNEINFLP